MVSTVQRPPGLRAGFHAEAGDRFSGLLHAGEQWAPARFLITPHTHPVWELYLQVHGRTRWLAGGQLVTLQPGHLLAVAPEAEHHMREQPGGNHHFYFAAVNVATVLARRPALGPAWQQVPPVVHRADGQLLTGAFDQLIRELTARRQFAADGLALAVDRLVLEVSRQLLETSELSITAIGLEVGFGSGQHLARVFGRLTGCTPREYRLAFGGRPLVTG